MTGRQSTALPTPAAAAEAVVTVLVLNWNGRQDTIECLESLFGGTYAAIDVVVLDNGSQDQSLEHLATWAAGRPEPLAVLRYDRATAEAGGDPACEAAAFGAAPQRHRLTLVDNGDNLGFAAGNNVGIRLALGRGSAYVLLLNNDTVIAPPAIAQFVQLLETAPALHGATAQIRYYDADIIWNCGGDLTWYGGRRYHLHGAKAENVPQTGRRRVTFITGCAAFFRTSLFREQGLLSERFFFGEEDFELSQRLLRAGVPLACCYGAVVRHKVSRSVNQAAGAAADGLANKVRLYYLNRFIDMRAFYPPFVWHVWRFFYLGYAALLLTLRLHFAPLRTARLLHSVWVESAQLTGISRETFGRVLRGQPAVDGDARGCKRGPGWGRA
jgi:GT2 family glycosyltransferase